QKAKIVPEIEPETYPLGEKFEQPADAARLALVALSHTPVERRLYTAMLESLSGSDSPAESRPNLFTARTLMDLTGIVSLSTVRRGLEGLVTKFSIEREPKANGNGTRDHTSTYRVFTPEEVIARREAGGMKSYEKGPENGVGSRAFE